jgi:DNA polymerase-3 subunit delta'
MNRRRALKLADSCAGRGAEGRYDAAVGLTRIALGRLARSAAGVPIAPVSAAEERAIALLASDPRQALIWAELEPALAARVEHARAVHLDPARTILDMLLRIDAAAGRARAFAA